MRPRSADKEQAIRTKALQLIREEGLENLSMQKLAKAAEISPRTIYLKYKDKEDLLIRLFIEEVLGAYEAAVLDGFDDMQPFADGVRHIWQNTYRYLTANREAFALMQYGKSSPLLNKAYQERGIREGQFFVPIHRFLTRHAEAGRIRPFPIPVYRALLFAPLFELVNESFERSDRHEPPFSEALLGDVCSSLIQSALLP
jgi:TetR/AcrR family transcriptional repressor of multidrug resistance operon